MLLLCLFIIVFVAAVIFYFLIESLRFWADRDSDVTPDDSGPEDLKS